MNPETTYPGDSYSGLPPAEPVERIVFPTVYADLQDSDWGRYFAAEVEVLSFLRELRLAQLDAYIARLDRMLERQGS